MGKNYTAADLEKLGLIEVEPGVYQRQRDGVKRTEVELGGGQKTLIADIPLTNEKLIPKQPIHNTPDFVVNKPIESVLTIEGIVAGLNGSKGLMRAHWSSRGKIKKLYRQIVRDQISAGKIRRHFGQVSITFIGYKSSFMDWDNFGASFKNVGDALVAEKVLIDDSPKVVVNFIPKQIKCKRSEQRVVIIIQDIT